MSIVFNAILAVTALGATAFPFVYHFTAAWWQTPMGRHLMGYSSAAALLGLSGIVRVFLPELPGQEHVRLAVISLACVFVWQRLFIVLKTQHESTSVAQTRRDERADHE